MITESDAGRGVFATTHWSIVLMAGGGADSQAASALESLCKNYWYPLYAYVRRRGRGPEEAADLTQSFFAHILEGDFLKRAQRDKGRFRNYLLGAMNHFMADEAARDSRQKRGGGREIISLDALDAEERYRLEPADTLDADRIYVRRWAMTVLDQALRRLEAELIISGKEKLFERLQGFLMGEKGGGTYAAAGAELGMSEAAVKMSVTRLRSRCRELLRDTIAQTVTTPVEAEEEFRALIEALRGG